MVVILLLLINNYIPYINDLLYKLIATLILHMTYLVNLRVLIRKPIPITYLGA